MQSHPFTPTIEDDHNCQLRRVFDSRRHAQAAALRIFNQSGKARKPVHCRHCFGWHLEDAQ